jgi:hypothetical protein
VLQPQLELLLGNSDNEEHADNINEDGTLENGERSSSRSSSSRSSSGSGGDRPIRTVVKTFYSPGDGSVRRKSVTSLLGMLTLREASMRPPPPEACKAVLLEEVQNRGLFESGLFSEEQINVLVSWLN